MKPVLTSALDAVPAPLRLSRDAKHEARGYIIARRVSHQSNTWGAASEPPPSLLSG